MASSEIETTQVWRINIKTAAKASIRPHAFCLENGIVGIGWPVECDKDTLEWLSYHALAETKYRKNGDKGWWPAANAIKNRVHVNDLCWSRDPKGIYYLGRVTDEWEYRPGKTYVDADLTNVRKCVWKKIGSVESVPGKIVNSFIPARTLQQVSDPTVVAFSQYKYNTLSEDYHYKIQHLDSDIFSLFSSDDCEDLVGLYLQSMGYYFIPSSCKSDTLAYEYVLKHKETGERAVAQVKNGYVDLDTKIYADLQGDVYLFTSKGKYLGKPSKNVHCIDKATLQKFMQDNHQVLPDKIKTWISLGAELIRK